MMSTETGSNPGLREQLLARAKLGEITPQEAEYEALSDGCEPLEVSPYSINLPLKPEPTDLDLEKEPSWTLLMTLVWIIARDPIAVRAVWVKARRACTQWVEFPLPQADETESKDKKGWELRPLAPPTVGDVEAAREVDEDDVPVEFLFPPIIVSGIMAREELWDRLCSGDLIAEGKRHGTGERTKISPGEWTTLDWLDDRSASADIVGSRINNAPQYDDVSLSAQKVREIWEPLETLRCEDYERENWSVDHAALWIAYGDPTLLRFAGRSNPRAKGQFSRAECLDPKPWHTLRQALMQDRLRAIRNGEKIPPEHWFAKPIPRNRPEKTRIYVARSAVRQIWPERKDRLSQELKNSPKATAHASLSDEPEGNFSKAAGSQGISQLQTVRKRGRRPSKILKVMAAMKADMDRGVGVQEMIEKELVTNYGAEYGAKRTTCREAREKLIRRLSEN